MGINIGLIVKNTTAFIRQYFGLHGKVEYTLYSLTFASVCIFGYMFCQIASTDMYYSQMGYDTFFFQQYAVLNCIFRHPLISFVFIPITLLKKASVVLFGNFDTRLVSVLIYALILSYAIIFLYRILKKITITTKSLLFIFVFISIAHVMIQSVVIDSYPISMALLLFTTLVMFFDRRKNIILDNIILAMLSGVTITNGFFLFLIFLFTESSIKKAFTRFIKSTVLLFSLWFTVASYILIQYIITDSDLMEAIWKLTIFDTPLFINNDSIYIKLINLIHLFFKETFSFHCSSINWLLDPKFHTVSPIITTASISLFSLITFASIYTIKTRLTKILTCWLLYCILLASFYGLGESYIFSAHWTFIIPILLASVKFKSKKLQYGWYSLIVITSMILFYHNATTFIGFFAPENTAVL